MGVGAAVKRGLLGSLAWILLAGALLMLWFVILSGVRSRTPLNHIWFLRADTSGIDSARHPVSQWTYFHICGEYNSNCDKAKAALPLGYAWYGNPSGAPTDLVGSHGHGTTSRYFYYMWRFGWVFYFLAFIFANFAILTGLLSCLKIGSAITGLLTLFSAFWLVLAACLMTAVFVKARDKFRDEGRAAKVGPYAFGFTWASLVLLFLSSILFLGNCFIGRHRKHHDNTAGPYTKEGYNTEPGYGQGNVQSGYTGGYTGAQNYQPAPPQSSDASGFRDDGERTRVQDPNPAPTMRGDNRRGLAGRLFPPAREPQV